MRTERKKTTSRKAADGLAYLCCIVGSCLILFPTFLLDFYFTENKCKLFIRMNFFVFLIVFNVFRDSIDQFLYVNRLGNVVIHA